MGDVLQFGAVMFTLALTGLVTYGGYVALHKWEKKGTLSGEDRRDLAQVNARLDRMELTLESLAVEMERVAEGQRFTSRLLAERNGNGASNGGHAGHAANAAALGEPR